MIIVQINATCGKGSTGKISTIISDLLTEKGIENYILYCIGESSLLSGIKYANPRKIKAAALESRILGNWGIEGKQATKQLITELVRIKPDIIHLHNIHSHACNLEMLFTWIKKHDIKVFWTFHDCWAFTGYCMHYDMIGCEKWKTECEYCEQRKEYSWFFDRSNEIFNKKKVLFKNIDLTIITPSHWMANQVRQSFLKEYYVKVIHNGIDLSVFKPTNSNFKEKYNCYDKYIVLGVAFGWSPKKGLDVFAKLSKILPANYQIVLVGTEYKIDKQLPKNTILIHRTVSEQELAEIYTSADVFVNPTYEEVLGLTNIEALACGTPVITFKSGGSPECIDETCGTVVDRNNINKLQKEIIRVCETKPYSMEACLERAKFFDKNAKFNEYIAMYQGVL